MITMLTGTIGALSAAPVRALTPYVYTPSAQELEGAGVGIGRTAAQLLRLGQPEEAASLAALAVRLQPNDERLWSVLAEAQLRSDQLKEAAESLAKAKALKPGKAGLWFAEASIALRDERPDDAISLLNEGLRLDPKNAGAYFDLGNARVMQSDLKKALKAFERATTIKPSFWEALNNQALVLFEMGDIAEAIKRWRSVLAIKRNPEPMLALAAALNQQTPGDAESIELASKALAEDPNYVLPGHQQNQLWGSKLRQATDVLLTTPSLRGTVERAEANADPKSAE
ncbi:tetratricopeptide repeat protein [Synechococcus sp. BIOS-U3-1]|uniref:tetratricopeptide repeat protein n=1 Tax=Synechococcus sp. BIOS-U3-1 TaxID=1400865 RepID=UPI00351C8138|tara:strand:- start:77 stop:931 length:855 start_codon:yes stop_codon:yes gene_type:complete